MKHDCAPPQIETWQATHDLDDDWQCDDCGQWWWIDTQTCYECHRHGDPLWVKFGTGDGTFPVVSTSRGLINYFKKQP